MNSFEKFRYYALGLLVCLLGVSIVISLFVERLNEWTFILAIPFILGATAFSFWTNIINKNKCDAKEVQHE